MFTIVLQEKGGEQRRMVFNKAEVTIGRVQGNDIVLPKGNVSKRHARIVLKDGKFIIVDLKSTNGTYVNGRKITSPLVVKDSDKIYIGDFIVGVDESASGDGPSDLTTNPPGDRQVSPLEVRPPRPTIAEPMAPMASAEPPPPLAPPARPVPPRPAPQPHRDVAASMPPIASPPQDGRPRSTLGRPGGTMPPPIAAIPPVAPPPGPTVADPQSIGPLLAPHGAQAHVVPLPERNRSKNLVGAGAKQRTSRSVSPSSRRGVSHEPLDPKVVKMLDLQANILERLRAKLDLDKIPMERLHEEDLWQRAERATIDLVEALETSGELPKYIDQDTLIKETLSEALALGPLEDLLADEKIDEIIIDRRDRVVVGKDGQMRSSGKAFSSDEVFERVVKRLVAEAGGRIDDASPVVDLRMRDGTRLTAIVSPVAVRGACLILRKAFAPMPRLAELSSQNAMSPGMADFLSTCVIARRNILVCGGSGSGKTTVAGAIAAAAPDGERMVSIEEVAELSIAREQWIQLETRAGSGKTMDVDLAALLESALRLMPDRLVVGEVRGRDALPLITALNSSVDGAVVAVAGDGPHGALNRLATLVRAVGAGAAPSGDVAIRELVAQAFEIVVHVARWSDGSVRVISIEEVVGSTETTFDTHALFQFRDGVFHATGTVPRFYSELEARGIPADQAVFR